MYEPAESTATARSFALALVWVDAATSPKRPVSTMNRIAAAMTISATVNP